MITIETTFAPLGFVELPEGIKKVDMSAESKRNADSNTFVQLALLLGSVPANVLAMWIFEKIRNHTHKPEFRMKINQKEITDLTEEGIRRVIEQEIDIEMK
ncbi:MAG: hypothetical protein K9M54_12630 [Kiritimatiellales bacterium]|nr:hypothetical protein [Kiritimatiellales bacterium]MCF7864108.1 hypothetical protein [Kiritimatiellales bacterium]